MVSILKNVDKIIVVGDKVLLRPTELNAKTKSGLYLPPGIQEKEQIQSGYVLKVGPGYPIPAVSEDEPWKEAKETVKYIPLQAKSGDLAIFLKNSSFEIEFEKEKLLIVPQHSILLLFRDDFI